MRGKSRLKHLGVRKFSGNKEEQDAANQDAACQADSESGSGGKTQSLGHGFCIPMGTHGRQPLKVSGAPGTTQRFGRPPWQPPLPQGNLAIKATDPSRALFGSKSILTSPEWLPLYRQYLGKIFKGFFNFV
jgi:hypothetical protein